MQQRLGLSIQTVANNKVPSQDERGSNKLNTPGPALQLKYIWQLETREAT